MKTIQPSLVWTLTRVALAACTLAALVGCQSMPRDLERSLGDWLQETLSRFKKIEDGALSASGTIEADEIRISSELGGRILEIAVQEGTPVNVGQMLVQLDDTPLTTRLLEAEAAVAVAKADLAVVEAGPRPYEIAAAEAKVALAEAERNGYKLAWQHAEQVQRNPQDLDARIAQARTQVQLAGQAVAQAKAELAKEKLIRDQKRESSTERDVAEWQVSAAEAKLSGAEADLQSAQKLLDGLVAIRAWPLGLIAQSNVANGKYQVADAGVVVARARLDDLRKGPTKQEIAVATEAVRLAEAKADVIRVQQKKLVLTSPIDGIVLNRVLNAGELAAPAATILTVADLAQLSLTVYVPVNRLGDVRPDQVVHISVDSYPEKTFAGRVKQIGDQPEYTPRNVATQEERLNTFYAVEIEVDNGSGLLKSGMPADAFFE